MIEEKRKGSKSTKEIPKEILEQLNCGKIETANLVEWLAVDQEILLKNLLIEFNRLKYQKIILDNIDSLSKKSVNTINECIGKSIFLQAKKYEDYDFLNIISVHKSDLIRCWATYTIGKNKDLTISEILSKIQSFASDKHFGVREICWLAIRERIKLNLKESIEILSEWVNQEDENIRRFASEATRPRGVWSEHIEELKQNPEMALSILEPLKSDKSKYVQNSVANWLNDASKTKPIFVIELCEKWKSESKTKETKYIIKKALRTIQK